MRGHVGGSGGEAFDRLAGDLGDELEVLVEVEDGEVAELGGGCDEQVGNGGGSVLPAIGEARREAASADLSMSQQVPAALMPRRLS